MTRAGIHDPLAAHHSPDGERQIRRRGVPEHEPRCTLLHRLTADTWPPEGSPGASDVLQAGTIARSLLSAAIQRGRCQAQEGAPNKSTRAPSWPSAGAVARAGAPQDKSAPLRSCRVSAFRGASYIAASLVTPSTLGYAPEMGQLQVPAMAASRCSTRSQHRTRPSQTARGPEGAYNVTRSGSS